MTTLTQLIEEKEAEFNKLVPFPKKPDEVLEELNALMGTKAEYKTATEFMIAQNGYNHTIGKRKELFYFLRTAMLETALAMERECHMNDVVVTANDDRIIALQTGFNHANAEKSRLEKEFINNERI